MRTTPVDKRYKVCAGIFLGAGIYGIVSLLPQYFLEEKLGRDFPPPLTHPEHFYGFIGVALAWQFVFLTIARNVQRYRLLILPATLEKLSFGVAALVLYAQGRVAAFVAGAGILDLLLAICFVWPFAPPGTQRFENDSGTNAFSQRFHPALSPEAESSRSDDTVGLSPRSFWGTRLALQPRISMRPGFLTMLVCIGAGLSVQHAFSQFVLTPVPGLPAVFSGSVAWGDYDNNGRMDFLLAGADGLTGIPQLLLWENTPGGFTNVTATVAPGLPGVFDSAVAWGDFDNDGRLDFVLTGLTNLSSGFGVSQVWRNTGGGFTNLSIADLPGVAESAAAWTDFDNDGRLDFLIAGTTNGNSTGAISQLWRNTGTGFTNVPIPGLPGVYFGSLACADFDNDGRQDFLITGITNGPANDATAQLWRNTGNGFAQVPIPGLRGVFVSSLAWGDFDNDGLLDFVLEGISAGGFLAQVWRNTGAGFTNLPVPGLPGVADGSLAWADYDNDGRLDFLITGLTNGATRISQLWRNTGAGFTNVPLPVPGNFDNSVAWGDYDNDSRMDFLVAGTIEGGNVSQLWRNVAGATNSPPAAPAGLSALVSGTTVTLNWNPPVDDHTPAGGLSYNVRIGTTPGGSDIVSAPALSNGTLLSPRTGPARNGTAVFHQLTVGQTYYWSVQAVDAGFAGSPFAFEQQFSTGLRLMNPGRHPDGVFEFGFTGAPGGIFVAVATTNISLSLSNWTVLGAPTEVSPGVFKFSDPQAPANPRRFYRVRSA